MSENEFPRVARSIDDIRIGPKRLTKYERARVVAARALQLAMGAPPLIDISKLSTKDFVIIAEKELEMGVLPLIIKRERPDGRYQLIPLRVLVSHERKILEQRRALIKRLFRLEEV